MTAELRYDSGAALLEEVLCCWQRCCVRSTIVRSLQFKVSILTGLKLAMTKRQLKFKQKGFDGHQAIFYSLSRIALK